ncbi:MAG: sulfatase-like hydrolase/transferase [Verrucomicrobiota bacterium]|nr:sulfatase-like hydrolase/transferase [Verrucomicrobiota bacterium]
MKARLAPRVLENPKDSLLKKGPVMKQNLLLLQVFFAALGLCLTAASPAAAEASPSRPNVIFILLDNVGQEWFGCYGSEERCTPHLDRLAESGVRVEHCYTPPVCGPSRIALLTGRYPLRTGFTLHHDAALYSGGGLDPGRELLFPRLFREAGYATAIAGKWQVNNLYDEPDVLTRHGFVEQLVWPGSVDTSKLSDADYARFQDAMRRESVEEVTAWTQHIESRYWDPVFLRNGRRETHPGQYGPDVAQAFVLDFIRRHRARPFLLYYPMVLTHGQTATLSVVPTPLNRDPNRSKHEMFADMLRYADKLVGDLIRTLDELELRDNTIVFVASDNGTEKEMVARRRGRDVHGGLYSLNEAGSDVVLLANSPKLIAGGRTLPLADFTDIYPTVCELAGLPLPKNVVLDGKSFAAFLRAEPGAKPPREWIFNQYHTTRVVRDERFKLYSDGRLFDANADPDEQRDVAASTAPDAISARERLARALAAMPPDAPPPFLLRSLSGFKIRTEERAKIQR